MHIVAPHAAQSHLGYGVELELATVMYVQVHGMRIIWIKIDNAQKDAQESSSPGGVPNSGDAAQFIRERIVVYVVRLFGWDETGLDESGTGVITAASITTTTSNAHNKTQRAHRAHQAQRTLRAQAETC